MFSWPRISFGNTWLIWVNCKRRPDDIQPIEDFGFNMIVDEGGTRLPSRRRQAEHDGPRMELPSSASKTSSGATDSALD